MNNEVKEIIDMFTKYKDDWYSFEYKLKPKQCVAVLDYITNIEQKVEQYENPDDMTLFYMWLDAKAKDKMKQIQEENERLKEELNRMFNRKVNAIKYIGREMIHYALYPASKVDGMKIIELLNGGDKNDNQTNN